MVVKVIHDFLESVNGLTFEYIHTPATTFAPTAGPITGGSRVRFNGYRLGQITDATFCEFRHIPGRHLHRRMNATATSADSVACTTPGIAAPGILEVLLISHSARLAESLFQFHASAQIDWSSPSHGPATGGTVIRVEGVGFAESSTWVCSFGASGVPARVVNDRLLDCIAPPLFIDSVVLLTLSERASPPIGTAMTFTYLPEYRIIRVQPSHGPVRGGTEIVISLGRRSSASALPHAQCAFGFGSKRVAASFVTAWTLSCISPAGIEGRAQVAVTSALLDFPDTTSEAFFRYVEVQVKRITPLGGPVSGQTRVLFTGINLGWLQKSTLSCLFDGVSSEASTVLPSQISCNSPRSRGVKAARLELAIGGDSNIQSPSFTFRYYADPILHSIHPATAPIHGSSSVTITSRA